MEDVHRESYAVQVAAVSGDVRRVLELCRKAAEAVDAEEQGTLEQAPSKTAKAGGTSARSKAATAPVQASTDPSCAGWQHATCLHANLGIIGKTCRCP